MDNTPFEHRSNRLRVVAHRPNRHHAAVQKHRAADAPAVQEYHTPRA